MLCQNEYYTLKQVCEKLHICNGTGRNRLSSGCPMPPNFRVGRKRLFPISEFEKWIEEQKNK